MVEGLSSVAVKVNTDRCWRSSGSRGGRVGMHSQKEGPEQLW